MERISASEFPVLEIQKFVRVHNNQKFHVTACAVSQNVDMLASVGSDFFIEPNRQWADWAKAVMECPKELCPPAKPERAWVKVYRNLCEEGWSVYKIAGQVQIIKLPMRFLGESHKECWGEIQIRVKQKDIKLGRHKCFDTRVGKWVEETKPIAPKKDANMHGYVALRFYHQSYLPENQPDWHFEPVYAATADKDFYLIYAHWRNEEISIAATPLNSDSSEIPEFLR